MGTRDYMAIGNKLGLRFTGIRAQGPDAFAGQSKGDRLLFAYQMARVRGVDLESYCATLAGENFLWEELDLLARSIEAYKYQLGKRDFSDILMDWLAQAAPPPLEVMFVDEAQDLSLLQWRVIERLSESCERIYLAGDDDQAIFEWAGSDVAPLQEMEGETRVLPKSYRVPFVVHRLAEQVIRRVESRVPKQWSPRPQRGHLEYIQDLGHLDMGKGSWLLLARNAHLLQRYMGHCVNAGLLYSSPYGGPVRPEVLKAVELWTRWTRESDLALSVGQIRKIFDWIRTGRSLPRGAKTRLAEMPENRKFTLTEASLEFQMRHLHEWFTALDLIPDQERDFIRAARAQGELILKNPRIHVDTIHGTKGEEADNVVLLSDMAKRTWEEMGMNPDAEHRVWYVGITRARRNLYIVSPETEYYYGF